MNHQPILRLARMVTERVVATVREAIRVATGAKAAIWHVHPARSRDVRAFDGIGEMNDYMLKDIGAPRWIISRADMSREAHHRRLAIPLVAALITAATLGWAGDSIGPRASAKPSVRAQWVGVFTGESLNGAPVYRLPPMTVIAGRSAELAKMKRQEQSAHAKQAPSKLATRPPA